MSITPLGRIVFANLLAMTAYLFLLWPLTWDKFRVLIYVVEAHLLLCGGIVYALIRRDAALAKAWLASVLLMLLVGLSVCSQTPFWFDAPKPGYHTACISDLPRPVGFPREMIEQQ